MSRALVGENPIRQFLSQDYWTCYYDWWGYPISFAPLAAGAIRARSQFSADSDADFLVLSVALAAWEDGVPTNEIPFPPILITIEDTGSGSNWTQDQIHITEFAGRGAGAGQGPMPLDVPRFVTSKSTVIVEADNLDVAAAYQVRLLFRGAKLYKTIRGNAIAPQY